MADFKIGQKPQNQTPDASWKLLVERTTQGDYVYSNLGYLLKSARTGSPVFMVKDRDLTAPPGSPAEGDTYIVNTPATGDWTGNEGNLAYSRYTDDTRATLEWAFVVPAEPMLAYIEDEKVVAFYDGTVWTNFAADTASGGVWTSVDASKWTAARLSTSAITMSDTSDLAEYDPIRINGTVYGYIKTIVANTSITVQASDEVPATVTSLDYGPSSLLRRDRIFFGGVYSQGTLDDDLTVTVNKSPYVYDQGKGHIVDVVASHNTVDAASQPSINISTDGGTTDVFDADIALSTADTQVRAATDGISTPANAVIDKDGLLSVILRVLGGGGASSEAADLTLTVISIGER